MRIALGASRRRLFLQVILETAVVGIGGVVLGLFLALTMLPVIKSLIPASLPRIDEVSIDPAVLLFGAVASFLSCLMAGLAAHWIVGIEPRRPQAGFTTTLGKAALLRRRLLLVTQTSLTVALLVGACLLLRSFWRISHVQLGFESDRLVAFQTRVIETRLARAERDAHAQDPSYRGVHQMAIDLREGLHRRLKEIPGLSDVAITTTLPFWDFDESTGRSRCGWR